MIEKIELNCGPTPESEPLVLDGSTGMTLFVGPNNSGKSVLLQSIYFALTNDGSFSESSLGKVIVSPFNLAKLDEHPAFKGKYDEDNVNLAGNNSKRQEWIKSFQNPHDWQDRSGKMYRNGMCKRLDGRTRLSMLPPEDMADLTNPLNPLARLLTNDGRRKNFQTLICNGIDHYPFIDTLSPYGKLTLAFSKTEPDVKTERSLDNKMVEYVKNSISQNSVSDGFNVYVGMIGALVANNETCILIDEPEAFLHPALARTLGKQIASHTKNRHVFVATHSAEYLMGAIEAGVKIQIARLQYQQGNASAYLLEGAELKKLMNDPMLRSANVLSGLFAQSVIVTEADTDRAFYQEINTRLLSKKDKRGINNAVFLNAQNKQTIPEIVKLMRKMGIPTVGIVDLDVVSEGGNVWTKQLDAAGIPAALQKSLITSRTEIYAHLKEESNDEKKKEFKWNGGIELLKEGDKEAAEHLIDTLKDYGLLVVPSGEVESWLAGLNISRSKGSWLHEIFEGLGSDSEDQAIFNPLMGTFGILLGSPIHG